MRNGAGVCGTPGNALRPALFIVSVLDSCISRSWVDALRKMPSSGLAGGVKSSTAKFRDRLGAGSTGRRGFRSGENSGVRGRADRCC